MLKTAAVESVTQQERGARHFRKSRLVWWPLVGVVVGYVSLASVFAWRTPAWENNDESAHVQYIEHVVSTGLPPAISLKNGVESHQAPLYYYVAAGWQELLQIPSFTPNAAPANASPNWGGAQLFYISHDYTSRQSQQAVWVHELRLLSILLGVITVVAAYATAWLLLRQTAFATAVAATVALWPKFLVVTTAVTNSTLAYALCAAGMPFLLLWWQRREVRWAAAFGLTAGLAVLTDLATLPVVALALLTMIVLKLQQRDRRSPVAAAGTFLGLTGWWFAYNALQYGDPLRSRITTHYLKPFAGGALVRDPPSLSLQILDTFGRVLVHSVWWDGGWNQLHLPGVVDWVFTIAGLVCVVAALAYRVPGWFMLGAYALGSGIAWLLLVRATTQGEGRYLLIALVAWAILLVSGTCKLSGGYPAGWWAWPAAFLGVDLWLVASLLIPYGRL